MMPSQSENSRPLVILLLLNKADFYDELYTDFDNSLRSRADVERATTPREAKAFFTGEKKPSVVLASDEALSGKSNASLAQDAATYVRSGGTIVFMGLFSSFSKPSDLKVLFSKFDLPWSSGSYHRTTFALNPAMTLLNTGGMAPIYSQKALHLSGVLHSNAVYLATDGSRIESAVFPPFPVDDLTETPATFASVGAGKVGYVGDVNNERETTDVVLRMCGLGL